ncbi:MAG: hypothetical protein WCL23_04150 [Candidatus Moraniibacteriota bacterium]
MEHKRRITSYLNVPGKLLFVFCGLLLGSGIFFARASDTITGSNIVDDPDQDGLTTAEEKLYGTDPMNPDTDGDGYTDGVEIKSGYDPLKKAPGDKIIPDTEKAATDQKSTETNLTDQVSEKIADIVKNAPVKDDGTSEVSLDDLNSISEDLISGNQKDIVLPDVDISSIKVKKESYSSLSDDDRKQKIKEDVTEYLTKIAYIFANNSPKSFKTQTEFEGASNDLVSMVTSALSLGSLSQLDSLVENANKTLDQIKEVEVPEVMLDVHVKALKLAMYAAQLHDTAPSTMNEDPMQSIRSLSYMQGLLNVTSSFAIDVQKKLSEYGISDIPLDL